MVVIQSQAQPVNASTCLYARFARMATIIRTMSSQKPTQITAPTIEISDEPAIPPTTAMSAPATQPNI
jgi:hypothetical protein